MNYINENIEQPDVPTSVAREETPMNQENPVSIRRVILGCVVLAIALYASRFDAERLKSMDQVGPAMCSDYHNHHAVKIINKQASPSIDLLCE